MLHHANLVVTAWDEDLLVGIARTLSDFAYVGYLADLAVRASHQRQGIGTALIQKTREQMGSPLHVGAPVRAESGRLLSKDGLYPT
jgi:GNAT superfamily N-acetyltransferase